MLTPPSDRLTCRQHQTFIDSRTEIRAVRQAMTHPVCCRPCVDAAEQGQIALLSATHMQKSVAKLCRSPSRQKEPFDYVPNPF